MGELGVLHITAPARLGGLESVVAALAAGQRARGHSVTVAAVLEPGARTRHPFLDELERRDVPAELIEVPARAYRQERAEIRELLRRLRPDVVHTHGYRTDVVDAPLARALGLPIVTTVHGFTHTGWKGRLYEALQVRAFRRFDAVVVVSKPLQEELRARGVDGARLRLHPNAWRPSGFLNASEARERLSVDGETFHVGWVGRLGREKAPDVFIEALGGFEGPEWTATVIGDGPLREDLEARCSALRIGDRVRWAGEVVGAGALLPGFDAFVLSSRTEGTPIVLLEAMAAGVPIVATAVGGVPDLVGEAAELVAPERPNELAGALRLIEGNTERRIELSRAGQKRMEAIANADAWVSGYDAIYEDARQHRNR